MCLIFERRHLFCLLRWRLRCILKLEKVLYETTLVSFFFNRVSLSIYVWRHISREQYFYDKYLSSDRRLSPFHYQMNWNEICGYENIANMENVLSTYITMHVVPRKYFFRICCIDCFLGWERESWANMWLLQELTLSTRPTLIGTERVKW